MTASYTIPQLQKYFKGDLNGDGLINQLDLKILADYQLVSYELED